jgi:hypothetical protein
MGVLVLLDALDQQRRNSFLNCGREKDAIIGDYQLADANDAVVHAHDVDPLELS